MASAPFLLTRKRPRRLADLAVRPTETPLSSAPGQLADFVIGRWLTASGFASCTPYEFIGMRAVSRGVPSCTAKLADLEDAHLVALRANGGLFLRLLGLAARGLGELHWRGIRHGALSASTLLVVRPHDPERVIFSDFSRAQPMISPDEAADDVQALGSVLAALLDRVAEAPLAWSDAAIRLVREIIDGMVGSSVPLAAEACVRCGMEDSPLLHPRAIDFYAIEAAGSGAPPSGAKETGSPPSTRSRAGGAVKGSGRYRERVASERGEGGRVASERSEGGRPARGYAFVHNVAGLLARHNMAMLPAPEADDNDGACPRVVIRRWRRGPTDNAWARRLVLALVMAERLPHLTAHTAAACVVWMACTLDMRPGEERPFIRQSTRHHVRGMLEGSPGTEIILGAMQHVRSLERLVGGNGAFVREQGPASAAAEVRRPGPEGAAKPAQRPAGLAPRFRTWLDVQTGGDTDRLLAEAARQAFADVQPTETRAGERSEAGRRAGERDPGGVSPRRGSEAGSAGQQLPFAAPLAAFGISSGPRMPSPLFGGSGTPVRTLALGRMLPLREAFSTILPRRGRSPAGLAAPSGRDPSRVALAGPPSGTPSASGTPSPSGTPAALLSPVVRSAEWTNAERSEGVWSEFSSPSLCAIDLSMPAIVPDLWLPA
jgi:hypothetical protein